MTTPSTIPAVITSRYRVERELGGGGMSRVYLADDLRHGRKVAVKVMRQDGMVSFASERFAREIEVTAGLTHPHILPLLDSGEVDGYLFYVMPYIEGESLRDLLLREGRLDLADALRITRDVADALAYAHGRDVVHRDIKPENILISAGHAVVADFGIARAISAMVDRNLTQVGFSIGTLVYMSPEQSLGEAVDGRTDLYALGCVLFEMLTGDVPFEADSPAAMIARKITGVMPDFGRMPDSVASLIQRAIARDVDERFQSASDMVAAIDTPASAPLPTRTATAPNNAIAVLAFDSLSPNVEDEYLGDGISEEIMHALTRLGGLRLIARTSAFAFKKSGVDVQEIGKRLRVRRIVEGSVRRSGNRIRVTAKLIDAESALELWSSRFDRQFEDVFDIQDEISEAVAHSLKDLLLAEVGRHIASTVPSEPSPATSVTAYNHYLKGRHFWALRSEDGLRTSVEHLEVALSVDPDFALAYAALADTLATMGLYGMAKPLDVMPLAREAAEQGLALDRGLSDALAARACVRAIHDWDWSGATEDFARAIVANPQYPTAHQWYAMHCLVPLRRFSEARASLAVARELDPLSLSIAVSIAAVDYYQRRFDEAITSSRAVVVLDPQFAMGHYFLGLALEQARRLPEAIESLESSVNLSGSAESFGALAHACAAAGNTVRARRILSELELRATQRYDSPVVRAQVHVALGEYERAVELLDEAQSLRAADLIWLGVRPTFDPLRSHPAFARLLESLQLPLSP